MEEKGEIWKYSSCPGCYATCGVRILVRNGVMVKIEGIEDSDMGAKGGLCGKGVAQLLTYYDPNRVNYPVKRGNPRKGFNENPEWQRISWDEALDTIAKKLKEALVRDPRRIAAVGTPSPGTCWTWGAFSIFFKSLGNTVLGVNGGVGTHCGNAAHFGAGLFHASWDMSPDFKYCNYAIIFGSNQGTGAGHSAGLLMHDKADARARGFREIVFDPMCNFAGGKAAEWVPILPGTDSAVILSMCNVLLNEINIYDADFIRNKTNGPYLVGPDRRFVRDTKSEPYLYGGKPFIWDRKDDKPKIYDDPSISKPSLEGEYIVNGIKCRPAFQLLKEHLEQYTPTWACEISSVPEDKIRRIAQEFAYEARIGSTIEIDGITLPYRPVAVGMYRGAQGHTNGFHQFMSVCLLNTIVGNLDVPGGALGWPARCVGVPETETCKYEPYAGYDGMLTPGMWFAHNPWPPEIPRWPETVGMQELFYHSTSTLWPYPDDFEEIWNKAGHPNDIDVMGVYGGNVAKNCANSNTLDKFFSKTPFLFSINTLHNETTEGFADIVLPDCHAFESLDIAPAMAFMFNYPIGLNEWCFHPRIPVIKPQYERIHLNEILLDLSEKMGVREKFQATMDQRTSMKKPVRFPRTDPIGAKIEADALVGGSVIVSKGEKVSYRKFMDMALKYLFGDQYDLKWFEKNGFKKWEKKVEEAYWRTFNQARVPVYFEFLEHERPIVKDIGEKIGIHMDWNRYTALLSYFPPQTWLKLPADSEYDMAAISYRDILHCGTWTIENPWLDEMSETNPYSYNIAINVETAIRKEINEADTICVETPEGYKVTGMAKLMRGLHSNVVAMSGHTGGRCEGQPIARFKGPYYNDLCKLDQYHIDPVSGSMETSARVKIYKVETRSK
jgi:anaerobic selenocysteine-containing dehydrogenase